MEEIGHILNDLGAEKNAKLDAFARMIEEENKIHNLTRIVGLEAIRARHFADSLAVLGELEKLFEKEFDVHFKEYIPEPVEDPDEKEQGKLELDDEDKASQN